MEILTDLPYLRTESGLPVPRQVVMGDDTVAADVAYRMMCEGTGMLWRGDFHNARQLLQALSRRTQKRSSKRPVKNQSADISQAFHLYRQALGQRARVLGLLFIPLDTDYRIPLRRAPDVREACFQAWGPSSGQASMVSLRELLGVVGAHEWRKKGVEISALGAAPNNRARPGARSGRGRRQTPALPHGAGAAGRARSAGRRCQNRPALLTGRCAARGAAGPCRSPGACRARHHRPPPLP